MREFNEKEHRKIREAYLDLIDDADTMEMLSMVVNEIDVKREALQEQIHDVDKEIVELDNKKSGMEMRQSVYNNLMLIINQMAVHRFLRHSEGWETGGNWREWHE